MSAGHEKVHLTAEQLRELEEELESQLLRLERSMRVTEEGLRPVELDHTAVGRLSRIDELQNQALKKNLREREEMKLGGILQALRRMEAGTYGRCAECDVPIPFERLAVFPETATCMDCGS